MALGLAVPTFLPTADGGVLGNRPEGEAGPNSIRTYNPIVALRGQLTRPTAVVLLRVTTNDPEPDYLRLTALDRFDGESWAAATLSAPATQRVARGLPAPPGLGPATPTRTVTASIAVQQLSVSWLPAPYAPRSVAVDGDRRYDDQSRTVVSTHADSRGLGYRVTATRPAPTPQQLRADLPIEPALARYLEVPANLPAQVRTVVRRVTADAATRAEKAAALQAYFRGPLFTYSLQVPRGNSTDALLSFLRVRRGYCEQFAAAMALLARVAGIPSRVAIGFTPGREVAPSTYSVTTGDAHAWPELYFPGAGWLRYEPTPSSDGRALVPGYTLPAPTATPDSAVAAPAADPATPPRTDRRVPDGALGGTASGAGGAARSDRSSRLPLLLGLAGSGTLLLLLAAPALLGLAMRRRRWSPTVARKPGAAAHAVWRQLLDDARDLTGSRPPSGASPRVIGESIAKAAALGGAERGALRRLVAVEERARYARGGPEPEPEDLLRDARAVRAALLTTASPARRWIARLTPPSTLGVLVGRWRDQT